MAMRTETARPQYLLLLSKDNTKIVFSSIGGDHRDHFIVKSVPTELQGMEIQGYNNGWLILLADKSPIRSNIASLIGIQRQKNLIYSLWNPLTSECICLPPLTLKHNQEIQSCILSSTLDNLDCMLILFDKKTPSLICSKICTESKDWSRVDESMSMFDDYLSTYECALSCQNVGIKIAGDVTKSIINHESIAPSSMTSYSVYSCGEFYSVVLVEGGLDEPVLIKVFKLDSVSQEWKKARNIKGRAFFLTSVSCFSCPASEPKIRRNCVYFTLCDDENLYSFSMIDKTITVFSAYSPVCFVPNLNINKNCEMMQYPTTIMERKERKAAISTEGDFDKLPIDIWLKIAKRLMPHDYMYFRTVNARLRLAAPPISFPECLEGYSSFLPLLMSCEKGDSICSFIDLLLCGEKIPVEIPNNQSKDVRMFYSRGAWCLMLQGERSMFLWNPSENRIVSLPDLPRPSSAFSCFSFSPSIDRVVLMGNVHWWPANSFIHYNLLGEGFWRRIDCMISPTNLMSNTLTFCGGAFYVLGWNGYLYALEDRSQRLFSPKLPCSSFRERFLIDCDGKLLSIFVGSLGKWVRIFELKHYQLNLDDDRCSRYWERVESLENHTLYVSRYSSFATTAVRGMENRVYFPRFYGKNAVYYSLESKKLHVHDTEQVLENFYCTKEQMYSSWIQLLA